MRLVVAAILGLFIIPARADDELEFCAVVISAMRLAKRLEKYWHDQGYPAARFWAEPVDERFAN